GLCPPRTSTPLPYTTLFRSKGGSNRGRTRVTRKPSLSIRLAWIGRATRLCRRATARRNACTPVPSNESLDEAGGSPALPALNKRSEEHTSELQSRGHLVCRL